MNKSDEIYQTYLGILTEELIPAMGCTEPIAIAYAAARARDVLGKMPERVLIEVSDNIVKNVKSVIVPNTGNLKGIAAAAAAGIVAGNADKTLEVIATVKAETQQTIRDFISQREIKIFHGDSDLTFDLTITVFNGNSKASVQISHFHTNIVLITKDDKVIYQNQGCSEVDHKQRCDRSIMNVKDIIDFAESVDIVAVESLLQQQIDYNMAIAQTGLKENWGANIGSVILNTWGDDIKIRVKALAAAASDARMGGCDMPVVIVSGSGNQGITASVPVIEYSRELGVDKDTLFRALIVSNLVTVHQKTGIGCLSAYCGAVSAGVGAGAGIAWLHGGRLNEIAHTIVNALAIVSGMICDGAKPSCAAKIASAVEAGILGFFMYQQGQQFYDGDGIIKKGVENTIASISRIGGHGMRETDKEVIRIMLGE
jgi:L-cysteine desulfidase